MDTVFSGLEVFLDDASDHAGLSAGARVGLVVHPASVDRQYRHAVDLIRDRGRLDVRRLFAPEHGTGGEAQDMESVGQTPDRDSGLITRGCLAVEHGRLCYLQWRQWITG